MKLMNKKENCFFSIWMEIETARAKRFARELNRGWLPEGFLRFYFCLTQGSRKMLQDYRFSGASLSVHGPSHLGILVQVISFQIETLRKRLYLVPARISPPNAKWLNMHLIILFELATTLVAPNVVGSTSQTNRSTTLVQSTNIAPTQVRTSRPQKTSISRR